MDSYKYLNMVRTACYDYYFGYRHRNHEDCSEATFPSALWLLVATVDDVSDSSKVDIVLHLLDGLFNDSLPQFLQDCTDTPRARELSAALTSAMVGLCPKP